MDRSFSSSPLFGWPASFSAKSTTTETLLQKDLRSHLIRPRWFQGRQIHLDFARYFNQLSLDLILNKDLGVVILID